MRDLLSGLDHFELAKFLYECLQEYRTELHRAVLEIILFVFDN